MLRLPSAPAVGSTRPAGAASPDSTLRASRRAALKDSLSRLVAGRHDLYSRPDHDVPAFAVTTPMLYNADAPSPSEALDASPLFMPVRFGLSSRMNRFLVYGNTAPISPLYTTGPLLPTTFDPTKGTDDVFTSEFSAISLLPNGDCRYTPYPVPSAEPEAWFMWENGLFDENILDVHLMRAMSDRLSFAFFSNYRHFDNTTFNHEGDGISSFYQSIDSANSVDQGYNPLTDEYSVGGRVEWRGVDDHTLFLGVKYTDCSNEIALNSDSTLSWADLHQFRSSFDIGSLNSRLGIFSLDLEGGLESVNLSQSQLTTDSTIQHGGNDEELSCAGRLGMPLGDSGLAAVEYRLKDIDRTPFTRSNSRSLEQVPALTLALPARLGPLKAAVDASLGYEVFRLDDSLGYTPVWSVSGDAMLDGQEVRVYARQVALPFDIPYTDDSILFAGATLLDICRIAGAEWAMTSDAARLVLGCQSVTGVQPFTVYDAWPEGAPPYQQPQFSLLAAPTLGPWNGLTLSSRNLISDTRPHVKSETSLAYHAHPEDTHEYIDGRLSFDYWSGRDLLTFAGISNWNRPVDNLSLEIGVHVRTFRFFAKADNLLDRVFAYVPGYYSPGLTFRWGINWFLQR